MQYTNDVLVYLSDVEPTVVIGLLRPTPVIVRKCVVTLIVTSFVRCDVSCDVVCALSSHSGGHTGATTVVMRNNMHTRSAVEQPHIK